LTRFGSKKGQPGADILQEVRYKGEVCGRIVFDSRTIDTEIGAIVEGAGGAAA